MAVLAWAGPALWAALVLAPPVELDGAEELAPKPGAAAEQEQEEDQDQEEEDQELAPKPGAAAEQEQEEDQELGPKPGAEGTADDGETAVVSPAPNPNKGRGVQPNDTAYRDSRMSFPRIVPFQDDIFIGWASPVDYDPSGVRKPERYVVDADINFNLGWDNTTEAFRQPSSFRWCAGCRGRPSVFPRPGKDRAEADASASPRTEVRTLIALAVSAQFSTQFRLFQDNEISNPVRMPTYQPGARVTLMFRHIPVTVTPGKDQPVGKSHSGYWGLIGVIRHYSNGQQGCSWLEGEQDISEVCDAAWADIRDQDLRQVTNRVNGDFSGNWAEIGLGVGWIWNHRAPGAWRLAKDEKPPPPGDADDRVPRFHVEGSVMFAGEIGGRIGGMRPELRELYGSWEIRPLIRARWNPAALPAPMGFEYQLRMRIYPTRAVRDDTERYGAEHRLIVWLPGVRGIGVYGEFQHGSSPQSLLFADDLRQGLVGLAFRLGDQVMSSNSVPY